MFERFIGFIILLMLMKTLMMELIFSIKIIHVVFSPFHRQYYTRPCLKHVLFFLFQRNESFKVSRGV